MYIYSGSQLSKTFLEYFQREIKAEIHYLNPCGGQVSSTTEYQLVTYINIILFTGIIQLNPIQIVASMTSCGTAYNLQIYNIHTTINIHV